MTADERAEMQDIVSCWLRDKEPTLVRLWIDSILWLEPLADASPELIADIATVWLDLSIKSVTPRENWCDEVGKVAVLIDTAGIESLQVSRCFELLQRIALQLINDDFRGRSRRRARMIAREAIATVGLLYVQTLETLHGKPGPGERELH